MIRFLATVTADVAHNSELRNSRQAHWPRQRAFIEDLVGLAVTRGELDSGDQLMAADTLTAMMIGLWQVSAGRTPRAQSAAIEGFTRLLTGGLIASTSRPPFEPTG